MSSRQLPTYSCVFGEVFNATYSGKKFYKILPESMVSRKNSFKYKEGLNVDVNEFRPKGKCAGYGLYFADGDNIHLYMDYGTKIAEVKIPDDARVYVESQKFKADKIRLDNIVPLGESKLWLDWEFCYRVVAHDPDMMQYIQQNNSIEFWKIMVANDPAIIPKMNEQTPELCKLAAIESNPFNIQYIKDQTLELCKLAIEKNPLSIRHIHDQTEELCMLAVNRKPTSICCISDQTPELCNLAVSKDPFAIIQIKNKTSELCKMAIEGNASVMKYIC
jgi:hypothetical protein